MTWIFPEDFEGCLSNHAINLEAVLMLNLDDELVNDARVMWGSGAYDWRFTTPEQAKAAYEKIKGMLKPPLIPQQAGLQCRYSPPTQSSPFIAYAGT